jgi:hypothetical protein
MKFADATKLDRKSGGAHWRACPERSRRGSAVLSTPLRSCSMVIFDRERKNSRYVDPTNLGNLALPRACDFLIFRPVQKRQIRRDL